MVPEELTLWKRPWCWEGLRAGGERDDRGWDGWMASPTRQTQVWVNSRNWWWTERPGTLRFMGSQRVRHCWTTEQQAEIRKGQSLDQGLKALDCLTKESRLYHEHPSKVTERVKMCDQWGRCHLYIKVLRGWADKLRGSSAVGILPSQDSL